MDILSTTWEDIMKDLIEFKATSLVGHPEEVQV